jgi:hypothetical protein
MDGASNNALEGMLGHLVAAHTAQLFCGGFARPARVPQLRSQPHSQQRQSSPGLPAVDCVPSNLALPPRSVLTDTIERSRARLLWFRPESLS